MPAESWSRGKRWTQHGIHVILSNPIYIGKLRVHGEVIPGVHPPIIDATLWGEAQALLKTTSRDRGRPAEGFLLSGRLLRCTCVQLREGAGIAPGASFDPGAGHPRPARGW